ncbi:MAG: MBL fold metallo-hydrolase [Gammaproteobacteria bacterium]|nr:MBL fold metallo-hydrolase [Gammaproteobacteria bacterium]MCP4801178.1 MBL fold metallo-hydrolase [bacterium]
MKTRFLLSLFLLIAVSSWAALIPEDDDVYVRVVDVGQGLCCIAKMPGDYFMVYDAGNYKDKGRTAMEAIRELINEDKVIDLLVLSHTDSDHLGAVDSLYQQDFIIERVIRSGMQRTSGTWDRTNTAIDSMAANQGTLDINLSETEFPVGATYRFGEATVTMVCGFAGPLDEWELTDHAEQNNAGSIVIRLQYRGQSILFCGDAVGRHSGGDSDQLIASELFMVTMSPVIPIDSDVVIAPHHGGRILLSHDAGETWTLDGVTVPSNTLLAASVKDGAWFCAGAYGRIFERVDPASGVPESMLGIGPRLLPNRPNPFNPSTQIEFELARPGHVKLEIFDARAQLVQVLLSDSRIAGRHTVNWNGRNGSGQNVPSGLYFCLITTNDGTDSRKLNLVK